MKTPIMPACRSASARFVAVVLVLYGFLATACVASRKPALARHEVVTVALAEQLDPFPPYRDPVLSPLIPWARILGRGLTRVDERGHLRGDLAGRITTPDRGFTWDFELRQGILLGDGRELTPARFIRLWDAQVRNREGIGWVLREIEEGPSRLGSRTIRFSLKERRPWFPRRLAHPWTFLVSAEPSGAGNGLAGPYVMERPAPGQTARPRLTDSPGEVRLTPNRSYPQGMERSSLLLTRTSAAGGLLLLEVGDARATRLTERGLAGARRLEARVSCARPAVRYALLFQTAGVADPDPALKRRLVASLDRSRLARRVVPATGRASWAGEPSRTTVALRAEGRLGPEERNLPGGARLTLLVDADDRVAVGLADQMQADLLESGVVLRVEARPGHVYDGRLRAGLYGVALAGHRTVFSEPALDLVALVRAAGLRTRELEDGLADMLSRRSGSERRLAARRLSALLTRRLMLVPLIEVDECWAHAADLSIRDDLALLTSVSARLFHRHRPEGSP